MGELKMDEVHREIRTIIYKKKKNKKYFDEKRKRRAEAQALNDIDDDDFSCDDEDDISEGQPRLMASNPYLNGCNTNLDVASEKGAKRMRPSSSAHSIPPWRSR